VFSGERLAELAAHPLEQVSEHSARAFLTLRLLLVCIVLKALVDEGRRRRLVRFLRLGYPISLLTRFWRQIYHAYHAPLWRHWVVRLVLLPLLVLKWLLWLITWPVRILLRYPLHWLWHHRSWRAAYALVLLAAVVAVNTTGLLGARLAHGGNHGLISTLFSVAEFTEETADISTSAYHKRIKPLLETYCVRCHGPGKQKGNLRLDSRDSMLAQRDPMLAVAPGEVMKSDVIRRLLLPRDHPDAMPPPSEEQPPEDLAATLAQWIDDGALFGEPPPPLEPPIEYELGRNLPSLPDNLVQVLRARGLSVQQLAEDSPLLSVSFRYVSSARLSAVWSQLLPVLQQIAWLDLSGHRVSTALMFDVGEMSNLTRLDLRGAEIGAGDVLALSGLPQLRWLNLRATGQGEALVTNLDLPSLKNLYLSTEPIR
jgi:hypothetical protein